MSVVGASCKRTCTRVGIRVSKVRAAKVRVRGWRLALVMSVVGACCKGACTRVGIRVSKARAAKVRVRGWGFALVMSVVGDSRVHVQGWRLASVMSVVGACCKGAYTRVDTRVLIPSAPNHSPSF